MFSAIISIINSEVYFMTALMLQFLMLRQKSIRKKYDHVYNSTDVKTTLYTYTTSDERKIEREMEIPMRSHNATLILSTRDSYAKLRNAHRKAEPTADEPTQPLIPTTSIYLRSMTIVDGCIIFIFGKDRYYPLLGSIVAHMPSK